MAWKLKDCIAVHQLLEKVLVDQDAALSKYTSMLPKKCWILECVWHGYVPFFSVSKYLVFLKDHIHIHVWICLTREL